jgi:hypothetical protein
MATETATKPNDTKPAETAKPAAKATPKRKPASRTKAKTAAKSRTRTTAKSRTRKPAARTPRTETATATPRAQAKALNGGQQFVAGVIDAQEKTVAAIVDYQTRAAELSQIPGATAVAEAQAKVLRSVTDTYVSAARTLLK